MSKCNLLANTEIYCYETQKKSELHRQSKGLYTGVGQKK